MKNEFLFCEGKLRLEVDKNGFILWNNEKRKWVVDASTLDGMPELELEKHLEPGIVSISKFVSKKKKNKDKDLYDSGHIEYNVLD